MLYAHCIYSIPADPTTTVCHFSLLPSQNYLHDNRRAGNRSHFLWHSFCHHLSSGHILPVDCLPHNNAHLAAESVGMETNHSLNTVTQHISIHITVVHASVLLYVVLVLLSAQFEKWLSYLLYAGWTGCR